MAGAALQQAFAARTDRAKHERDLLDRNHSEQHQAFVELVKAARRVQRALVDLAARPGDDRVLLLVGQEIDRLAESVAGIRLVVPDQHLIAVVEAFEERAKDLERDGRWQDERRLQLAPLIEALREYEQRQRAQSLRSTRRRGGR